MGIIYDLWELPKTPQKKVIGVGYSSTYLTNEDKSALSYKIWVDMIHKCYGMSDTDVKRRSGKNFECSNSWLDYQKFIKWFQRNYKECQRKDMILTWCVISRDNITYNPNNCAVVPKEIHMFLLRENRDFTVSRKLAETYKDCITEDIYELLTEDY